MSDKMKTIAWIPEIGSCEIKKLDTKYRIITVLCQGREATFSFDAITGDYTIFDNRVRVLTIGRAK